MTVAKLSAAEWLERIRPFERAGDNLAAYDLAMQAREEHPGDPLVKHRQVLMLARSGATEHASRLYRELGLDKLQGEDFVALGARLLKDRALAASGAKRRELATESADRYEAAFRDSGGTSYSGINAATMRLVAGDGERSRALASEALARCARESGDAFWLPATVSEARLLLKQTGEAADSIRQAADAAGGDYGRRAVALKQLRWVSKLEGIDENLLLPLVPPAVIHYTGHRVAPPGQPGPFPAEVEDEVRRRIGAALTALGVGFGFGSLACGADILFAEELLRLGAELHVVLPFDKDEFEEVCVATGGPGWRDRFHRCLEQARSVIYSTTDHFLDDPKLFVYASRLAMGFAVLRAEHLGTTVQQIAVWNRSPASGDSTAAGTAGDVAFWRQGGRTTQVILVAGTGESSPGDTSVAERADRSVKAVLFGDFKGFSKLKEGQIPPFFSGVMGAVANVLGRHQADVLSRNTWGDGLYLVFGDATSAARCGLEMLAELGRQDREALGLPQNLMLRLGGHLGPVYRIADPVTGATWYSGVHVSRAARVEPVTPPGQLYVTEPFAAALALDPGAKVVCEYMGLVESAKSWGAQRMYLVRPS